VDGDPATQIVKFAEDSDTSLVVIATHGHGPFRRFLLGSVTAKVLHDATCAVWTGAHLEQAPAAGAACGIRAVLCAVDLGTQTEVALEWASGIASAYEARLCVLHVLAPAHNPERQRRVCEEARQRLECQMALLHMHDECRVTVGDVTQVTGNTARSIDADLLVIGRGHLKGGGRLRSTSYSLLRESQCPVVSA
jgi:nucleotide-binding universal stress UspA family protein